MSHFVLKMQQIWHIMVYASFNKKVLLNIFVKTVIKLYVLSFIGFQKKWLIFFFNKRCSERKVKSIRYKNSISISIYLKLCFFVK